MSSSKDMRFPIAYSTFGDAEKAAVVDCLDRRQTTMGDNVQEFEDAFARYIGVTDAIMVNSGSSADLVIMMAAREMGLLKAGDEIVLPAVTWPTQAWAAIEAGFKVRLVDVDTSTLNVSRHALEPVQAKAYFAAHIMGNPVMTDCPGVLFEDCCEALGSKLDGQRVGSFGRASAFSFFHSHHISTMEGGMVCTSDPDFADCCRQLRAHGWIRDLRYPRSIPRFIGDPRYHFIGRGFNFRPTELQGALGLVQLARLDEFNAWRSEHHDFLSTHIRPEHCNPVFHVMPETYMAAPAWFAMPFVLKPDLPYSRQDVFDYLGKYGIETRPIVGGNLARQPAFSQFRNFASSTLDNADVIHDRGFYIGLPPFESDLWPVVNAFQSMHSHLAARHVDSISVAMRHDPGA